MYVVILVGVAVTATVFALVLSRPKDMYGSQSATPDPAEVVSEYWKASGNNDPAAVERILTGVPREFSKGLSGCEQGPSDLDETAERPNEARAEVNTSQGGWIEVSKEFSRSIYENKLKYLGVREATVFGENAILQVAYSDAGLENSEFYLLHRVNDSWKIFMITDGYAVFNKNFGKCR
jgi:hypothetical protein